MQSDLETKLKEASKSLEIFSTINFHCHLSTDDKGPFGSGNMADPMGDGDQSRFSFPTPVSQRVVGCKDKSARYIVLHSRQPQGVKEVS